MSKAMTWIVGPDTGISSKTIWAVMMGVVAQTGDYCIPYDPSDFGRCHRLLQIMPEWRSRLNEVASMFPEWTPLVKNWGELEALYLEELPTGRCPKLYNRMLELRKMGARNE